MTDEQARKEARTLLVGILDNPGSPIIGVNPQRWDEQVNAIIKALSARERAVWLEAAKLACPLCAKGYPLQKSGCWHNDMNGKDTLVNACCRGNEYRRQAEAVKP